MSNRERWTVYPLLFLTLGISLRDKVTVPEIIKARSVQCAALSVLGSNGKPRLELFETGAQSGALVVYGQRGNQAITLGTSENGGAGQLVLHSADGRPQIVMRSLGKSGAIETLNAAAESQVVLSSNSAGGTVTTMQHGKTAVALGVREDETAAGMLINANDGTPRVLIRAPAAAGSLETLNAAGVPQVVLNSSDRGGVIEALGNDRNLIMTLGHEPSGSGLFALNQRDNQMFSAVMMPNGPAHPPTPAPGDAEKKGEAPQKPADPPGAVPPAAEKPTEKPATGDPSQKAE